MSDLTRKIVLDTETTGLVPTSDRIIEIGAVEVCEGVITGRVFHQYINPQRDSHPDALKVHGLERSFLERFPVFQDISEAFLTFIGDSPLIIHNARFDISFLNAELKGCERSVLQNPVIDTLILAKQKFPGAQVSLDALCRHFQIDASHRTYHGALLDAHLLSHVYIELTGGKQRILEFTAPGQKAETIALQERIYREPRVFPLTPEEERQYLDLMEKLKRP